MPNRAVQVMGTGSMLPLGRMRLQIVEIDGDQLDIRKTLRQPEYAAAKLGNLVAFRARALREDQDRPAPFEQAFDAAPADRCRASGLRSISTAQTTVSAMKRRSLFLPQ